VLASVERRRRRLGRAPPHTPRLLRRGRAQGGHTRTLITSYRSSPTSCGRESQGYASCSVASRTEAYIRNHGVPAPGADRQSDRLLLAPIREERWSDVGGLEVWSSPLSSWLWVRRSRVAARPESLREPVRRDPGHRRSQGSDSSRTAGPRRTMSFSSSIASACQMPCLRAPQRNRRRCREEEGAGNDSPRPLGRTLPVATPRRAPQMAFVPVGVLKDPGF